MQSKSISTDEGRHLHPYSVPYRTVTRLSRYIILLLFFIVIPAATGGQRSIETVLLAMAGIIIPAILLVAAWETAYHRRYIYTPTPDSLDIQSGVISKQKREIPLGRIQNIDVKQNIAQRLLGIAELNLETAGGTVSEATLRYISTEEARRLQSWMKHGKEDKDTKATIKEEKDRSSIYNISPNELFLLSIFSIDLRLIAAIFFILSFIPTPDPEQLQFIGFLLASATLLILTALIALTLMLWIIGIATSFTRYYAFTLWDTSEALEYERGLLNRYSGSIPVDKIQSLSITENLLMRIFGYSTLAVETAGYSPAQSTSRDKEVAVPLAKKKRVNTIINRLGSTEKHRFNNPPRRARRRYLFRYVIMLFVITALVTVVNYVVKTPLNWYMPLILVPLTPLAAHLKWKHTGYFIGESYVATRTGFWVRSTKVVPYYRFQSLDKSTSVLQRRWGLSTLNFDTAGSYAFSDRSAKAIDMDGEEADDIMEYVYSMFQRSLMDRRAGEYEGRVF